MLTNLQIENYLFHDKHFLGCFPCDNLPPFPRHFPKTLIVNTDYSSEPGDHWVGLVLTTRSCFYFDSYGIGILQYNILKYIKDYYSSYIYSIKEIQDLQSEKCGEFSMAFVLYVKSVHDYKLFLDIFDGEKFLNNDIILSQILIPKLSKSQKFSRKSQQRLLKKHSGLGDKNQ